MDEEDQINIESAAEGNEAEVTYYEGDIPEEIVLRSLDKVPDPYKDTFIYAQNQIG